MSTKRSTALSAAIKITLAGSVLSSFVAHAQTAPSAKPADAGMGDVVVTGSRIAVPNEVSISPVIGVSEADIQQTGVTRVEDLLNSLPQVFASQGSNISNGSDGTATVNLRNLGSNRNLVLVNGRRLGPGDPGGGSAADLNQIPAELVERVDVLTGGASSVYGADAVAGVVNFQMNNHFEGVKLVTNYSYYSHDNHDTSGVAAATTAHNYALPSSHVNTGDTKDLAFIMGMNTGDGKGNVTAYATYRNVAPVLQASYDYSACTVASGYATGSGAFSCGGSSTSYPGRFRLVSSTGKNLSGSLTLGPNGTLVPYTSAYAYNYGPLNYYQRPDVRWTAGSFAHYELNEHADVYSEIMFMKDNSLAQIAPSGSFYGNVAQLHCSNPYLSAAMVSTFCPTPGQTTFFLNVGRRNVEGGGRQYELDHQSTRIVIGSKGKIDDAWSYDAYAQFGYVDLNSQEGNDLSSARINLALDAVSGSNGTAVCASAAAVAQGCTPWNIFQSGGVTQASLNYMQVPAIETGEVKQYIGSANFTGDLGKYGVKVPTAASGVKVNVGAEWREVVSQTNPDIELTTGDIAGSGSATKALGGEIRSMEEFVEANIPLMDDHPFAKSLLLNTGFRASDYSLGFNTNTYKYGLEWTPVDELRVRGSWARAVRAPNVGELFSAQVVGLDGSTDPCSGTKPIFTAAQCALTGVTAAQYGHIDGNPASQYNGLVGGNPNVGPETAITKSFGLGWTPAYIHGLRVQADWYDIRISNIIATVGADTILDLCATQGLYCSNIHRDINGTLWASNSGYIVDNLQNSQSSFGQKGIDLDTSYAFNAGAYGKVRMSLIGTYLLGEYGSSGSNCVGLYGVRCGIPTPTWRHTLRTTWQTPWNGADVSLAWRYIGSVKNDYLSSDDALRAGSGLSDSQLISEGYVPNTDAYLSSRSYIDLTGSIKVNDVLTVRMGINNLLDKDPPVFGSSTCSTGQCNGNTFPQVYDALGRYLFVKVVAQF